MYELTAAVEAVRYEKSGNEERVAAIVRGEARRASYTNMNGSLHFYNDGPELFVNDGDWVMRLW